MEQLEPDQLKLLKRYDAELQELESLPPAAIELTARQALALITHMQIAATNPTVRYNPLLQSAIAAAKQIQSTFSPNSAIYELLELGWNNEQEKSGTHLPSQVLVSEPCRKKVRRSPAQYRRHPREFR